MPSISVLPAVNATLNASAAVLLTCGFIFIRRGDKARHKTCMLAAFSVSTLFLISYVVYHVQAGSTEFTHRGAVRWIYFVILISHVVLAVAIVPLALVTLVRGLRERFDAHRRIARWTWPIWMYVSVTGVLIYFMLYHWFPPPAAAI